MGKRVLEDKFFDYLNDAVVIISKGLKVLYLNKKAKELFSLEESDIIGQDYFAFCKGKHIEPILKKTQISSLFDASQETLSKTNFLRKTNNNVFLKWRVELAKNKESFVAIGTDLSSSFALKDEIRKNECFFKNILENVPGYIFWKDKSSRLLGCNKNFADIAGETTDSIIGKFDYELPWKANEANKFVEDDRAVIETGEPKLNVEETMKYANGKEAVLLTSKVPLRDHEGEICGVVGVFIDITERREQEIKLQEAKEAAESALAAKTQFLENMRHDIRTALEGIIGFAGILKKEAKDHPYFQECAENLELSGNALLSFLNRILETIRITSGNEPILLKKCDLQLELQEIIDLHKALARQKGVQLTFDYDPNIPHCLIGDTKRISRILLELLSNALKFTAKGQVMVQVALGKQEEQQCALKLLVKDTGCGIPASYQDEVYTLFNRETPSWQGVHQGIGVGLSLVRQFIKELGAEIDMESVPGEGTLFSCMIPVKVPLLEESASKAQQTASVLEFKPLRLLKPPFLENPFVLLVEDNSTSAMMASTLLEACGYEVDWARDAQSALRKVNKTDYGLILLNIGLPDMPGYECAKQIRKIPGKAKIPLVALSSHAEIERRQDCLNAGILEVLAKPLTDQMIRQRLSPEALENLKPPIDTESLQKDVGHTAASLRKTLSLYAQSLSKELSAIESAYQENNLESLEEAVIQTKGGAMIYKAFRLQDACEELEHQLRKKGQKGVESSYQRLWDELKQIQLFLNQFLAEESDVEEELA